MLHFFFLANSSNIFILDFPNPSSNITILSKSIKDAEFTFIFKKESISFISALSKKQIEELKATALKINGFLNRKAKKIMLEHADGKVEFGLNPENELILVDVSGTLDEDRFLFNGFHISKQVLRDYYKKTPWYAIIEKEKTQGKGKGNYTVPPALPKELIEIVSNMYKSVTVAWTGEKNWKVPSIKECVNAYKKFLAK